MILNIENKYKKIEQDLINNSEFVFKIQNYYKRKYSYLSDKINDVNVGLFLDDYYNPIAQIFIRNKTGYIRTHLIFNYDGTKVIDIKTLNNSFKK